MYMLLTLINLLVDALTQNSVKNTPYTVLLQIVVCKHLPRVGLEPVAVSLQESFLTSRPERCTVSRKS